ncbi:DUF397 domain-containing protein [Pseudonocardia sp. RS010]|uniref:DUF397 domain-containing protein n=1 Tax=Pseudonocardia sp. RS010 TaxID=3385979 RepID=UPI0039A30C04
MIEFRTSSFCNRGSCVEVGRTPGGTFLVRDTKNSELGPLEFTREEWAAFVAGVKAGEFEAS